MVSGCRDFFPRDAVQLCDSRADYASHVIGIRVKQGNVYIGAERTSSRLGFFAKKPEQQLSSLTRSLPILLRFCFSGSFLNLSRHLVSSREISSSRRRERERDSSNTNKLYSLKSHAVGGRESESMSLLRKLLFCLRRSRALGKINPPC